MFWGSNSCVHLLTLIAYSKMYLRLDFMLAALSLASFNACLMNSITITRIKLFWRWRMSIAFIWCSWSILFAFMLEMCFTSSLLAFYLISCKISLSSKSSSTLIGGMFFIEMSWLCIFCGVLILIIWFEFDPNFSTLSISPWLSLFPILAVSTETEDAKTFFFNYYSALMSCS